MERKGLKVIKNYLDDPIIDQLFCPINNKIFHKGQSYFVSGQCQQYLLVESRVSDFDVKKSKQGEVSEKKMEMTRVATEDCPICLDPIKMGLSTSCGHKFCGDCILEVWRREMWWREMWRRSSNLCWFCQRAAISTSIPCPMCRQKVTDMVPYLSEEERNTEEPGEVELRSRILEEAERYQRVLYSIQYLQDVPVVREEDGEVFDDQDDEDGEVSDDLYYRMFREEDGEVSDNQDDEEREAFADSRINEIIELMRSSPFNYIYNVRGPGL